MRPLGRTVLFALWALVLTAQVSYEDLLTAEAKPENWMTYSGTYKSQHYSGLKQITRENVGDLELKWIEVDVSCRHGRQATGDATGC